MGVLGPWARWPLSVVSVPTRRVLRVTYEQKRRREEGAGAGTTSGARLLGGWSGSFKPLPTPGVGEPQGGTLSSCGVQSTPAPQALKQPPSGSNT